LHRVVFTAHEDGKSIFVGCLIHNQLALLLAHAHVNSPIVITFSKEIFKASLDNLVSSGRQLVTLHYDEISFG
jgi:hypothetical protein